MNKYDEKEKNDLDNEWHIVEGKKQKSGVFPYKIGNIEYYQNERNQKKILCNNILKYHKCTYGNKCLYAHSLDEQNVDYIKKKAYDIIRSSENINIDLSKDEKLSKIFLQFTKICDDCKNKVCPGGYNCKYGTVDEKYQTCYDDIMTGNCTKENCKLIHLTQKGIKPIIPIVKPKNEIQNKNKKIFLREISTNGTILNDDFFVSLNMNRNFEKQNNYDSDSEGESIESIEKIKEYLEEYDSDENCDSSIFL